MESIKKNQLGGTAAALKRLHKKFGGRVTAKFAEMLEEKGFVLVDLGTSKRCYTFSGMVGYHRIVNDDNLYFGIGISNRLVRGRRTKVSVPLYRAYVKRVEK